MTKCCYRCKQTKPIELFSKNHCRKDGHDSLCKSCKSETESTRRQEHKTEYKNRDRTWRINHPLDSWADVSLRSHRKKGSIIDITVKELVGLARDTPNCSICGCGLNWSYGTKNGKLQSNSPTLDRTKNENTINRNNIMIICHSCNATKRNRTMDEFVEYCEMISKKFAKRPCIDRLHTDRDVCKGTTDSPKVALA